MDRIRKTALALGVCFALVGGTYGLAACKNDKPQDNSSSWESSVGETSFSESSSPLDYTPDGGNVNSSEVDSSAINSSTADNSNADSSAPDGFVREDLPKVPVRVKKETPPAGFEYFEGDYMYDFTATTIDGKTITLSELLEEKDAVVLNFWATWCSPCKAEFPELQEVYEWYSGAVEVLAFCVWDTASSVEKVRSVQQTYGLTFPIIKDDTEDLIGLFYTTGIPTTVVIDRSGMVVYAKTNRLTYQQFIEQIELAFDTPTEGL